MNVTLKTSRRAEDLIAGSQPAELPGLFGLTAFSRRVISSQASCYLRVHISCEGAEVLKTLALSAKLAMLLFMGKNVLA
jgi:hypothetical protein